MIKVAVTGNIGSGKTEFIKFISKLGFCCISSDAIISKLYNNFNVTVFVKSDTIKRKKRVLNRGVTEDYFKLMNNKQIKENIKKNKSTFTVNNNGSILNLRLNIIKLLNKL